MDTEVRGLENQSFGEKNLSGWGKWLSVLVGAYPFLFFGPVLVLLSYPYPYPAWHLSTAFRIGMLLASTLTVAVGFSVGWLKRFPLWSYPYLCAAGLFLYIGGSLMAGGRLDGSSEGLARVIWLLAAGLLGLLIYVTRQDLPVRDLIRDVGGDWTRLSLGLLIIPAMLFSGIDHDEDPTLTIAVIGPTLVLLLTAVLALLAQSKHSRALILLGGMVLMIVLRLLSGKWFFLIYWLLSILAVFAPYLIQLRARIPNTRQQA